MIDETNAESVQALGIDSVASHVAKQEIQIGFQKQDSGVLVVNLPGGALAPLFLGLLRCAPDLQLPVGDTALLGQPVHLRSIGNFVAANGRKGLLLGLTGVTFHLALTDEQVDDLKSELESLSGPVLGTDHRLN